MSTIRTSIVCGVVVSASALLMGAAPPAGPAAGPVAPAQSIATVPATVTVTGFTYRGSDPASHKYGLVLHNSGKDAAHVTAHLEGQGTEDAGDATVPPRADLTVELRNVTKRPNCSSDFAVWVTGPGAENRKHAGVLDTVCTFNSQVVDSLGLLGPDPRHNAEADKVYLGTVAAPAKTIWCGMLGAQVSIVNKTPAAVKDLTLTLNDVNNGPVLWQQKVDAPAGNAQGVVKQVSIQSAPISGDGGAMRLILTGSSKLASQSVEIAITPTCSANAHLADQ